MIKKNLINYFFVEARLIKFTSLRAHQRKRIKQKKYYSIICTKLNMFDIHISNLIMLSIVFIHLDLYDIMLIKYEISKTKIKVNFVVRNNH